MAATALIQLTQSSNVGTVGQALFGSVSVPVLVTGSHTGVASWQVSLLYAPSGSALATGTVAFNNNGSIVTASFTPDVAGPYRIQSSVWSVINRSGTADDTDIRNFGIKQPTGFFRPAPQIWPRALPPTQSGESGNKPDENNFGGQSFGWSGNGNDGLLDHLIRAFDQEISVIEVSSSFVINTSAPLQGGGPLTGSQLTISRQTTGSIGTYDTVTVDQWGQVGSGSVSRLNRSGDTMSGTLDMGSNVLNGIKNAGFGTSYFFGGNKGGISSSLADWTQGDKQVIILTGNISAPSFFTPPPQVGGGLALEIRTNGFSISSWPSGVLWDQGATPTQSSTGSDVAFFNWNGANFRGSYWHNSLAANTYVSSSFTINTTAPLLGGGPLTGSTLTLSASTATKAIMQAGTSNTDLVSPAQQKNHPGHPKAWAYVTVGSFTAGVPTLSASFNISSVTDVGVGALGINFTTAFTTVNWCCLATCEIALSSSLAVANVRNISIQSGTIAAGSVTLLCTDETATTALPKDPKSWHFVGFGTQ